MKIESVRLLHAQGAPNHYIANQVYQPIDEDHRERGSFIILFDHVATENGAFLASLINTLIREYYRHHNADRLSCFEQTLVRLNDQIKQYLSSRDTTGLTLNGCVVLSVENEIHITYIGQPTAMLLREGQIIPLIEQSEDAVSPPSFSVITSGEILPNDRLVLSTLSPAETSGEEITEALSELDLNEATRHYARLLKQRHSRATEALFIRFNQESDATYQVYMDGSLESTQERLGAKKEALVRHAAFIFSGVEFFGNRMRHRRPNTSTKAEKAPEIEPSLEEAIPVITHESDPFTDPTITPYQVRHYREFVNETKVAHIKNETVIERELVLPHPTPRVRIKPRTIYLLVGILTILAIIIRITNSLPLNKPVEHISTVDRDAIIKQAEEEERAATAAQVEDDTSSAIDHLLTAKKALNQIPEEQQNETSKTVLERTDQSLLTLTQTIPLKTKESQPLTNVPKLVANTAKGVYVSFENGTVQLVGKTATTINGLPEDGAITAITPFDSANSLAFLIQKDNTTEVYTLDTTKDDAKQLTRTDNQPWPQSRLITRFEKNLYLIGDSMWKGMPRGDKSRVVPYASLIQTKNIDSVVENNGFFYATENGKDLVRLESKGSKTPVKIFGIPESFMPSSASLIDSHQENTLFLFDKDGQRILIISTDGAYRKQYTLPKDTQFSMCDTAESTFSCITNDKKLITLSP